MSLKPGQIQFHQWCPPPLLPGDYKVGVTQTVAELDGQTYKHDFAFTVAGPRFSLQPADIYSVYPPKDEIGDFANSLPHVVFTRRTLPWERNLHLGGAPAADKPWMAILLFSAADFSDGKFPELKAGKVGDLINPGGNILGPKLKSADLAAGESEDLCNTIDLPGPLFRRIAPKLKDVQYLAHVREVDTGDKETLSFLADGWFSVVLGNRFPEPELANAGAPLPTENRAVLVSLEGLEDYLPGGSDDPGDKKVRLAVLASWSFRCRKTYSFKTSMDKLKAEGFRLPPELLSKENPSEPQKYVSDGFNRGYTALNHHTRIGEDTVSWYRGPLTPVSIGKKQYVFRPVPDGLLRYDYRNGLMDATYAAAAQLGRLLGLQDRSFARALCDYRSKLQSQIRDSYRKQELMRELNAGEKGALPDNQLLEFGLRATLTNPNGKTPGPPPTDESALFRDGLEKEAAIQREPPPAVSQWLARLTLLYRVPFFYLVPDERMLPSDSLRFFILDPGWIKCLLEGACSVGRNSTEEQLVDELLRNRFLDFAIQESLSVRQRPESEHGDSQPEIQAPKVNWPLTGFLLRSPLVAGWQGVEMRAWQSWNESTKTGERLLPVRIDRLGPDIMLCIFNGPVVRIEIQQPPEGMHFGAAPAPPPDPDGPNYFKTTLRRVSPEDKAGDQVRQKEKNVPLPMRAKGMRVVEMAKLAETLEKLLKLHDEPLFDLDLNGKLAPEKTTVPAMDPKAAFTSAEMGVQMTESPGKVFIEIPIREREGSS
ncbi:MAG TPA: hypothetical protein VJM50_01680 [Pyrinomonadaceae bacterium]|nr:hypothetical protein [Pyrinomonadaceae bacterium]